VIYDLIQIRHPDLVSPGSGTIFRRWFDRTVPFTDRIVTISRAVRDDVRLYLRESGNWGPVAERLGWFHLGCDFDRAKGEGTPSADLLAFFAKGFPPSFLVVGTLEPRKSQTTVLDAFERLWDSGDCSRLILVGREGWGSHALTSRMRRHRELGRRLLWIRHANDEDLEFCYRNATALIVASTNEGFGLPIVEALHREVPVIATDIPVFREVGGDEVTFVPPGDVDALAKAIGMAERGRLKRPAPGHRRAQSWADSTRALIAQLVDHDQ
jgi:alpha-1,2-rhamnosyltransferase